MFTRDIAKALATPSYRTRRALRDLEALSLIRREGKVRNGTRADYWLIDKPILGVLRLIPSSYLAKGRFQELVKQVAEKRWHQRFDGLVKLFSQYTGLSWIVEKEVSWSVDRDGMMDYSERRTYKKLGDTPPIVTYLTIHGMGDDYHLRIVDNYGKKIKFEYNWFRNELGTLRAVSARVERDVVEKLWKILDYGESFTIKIFDNKRLYACPAGARKYMACFPYSVKAENIDSLKLRYRFSNFIGPVRCSVWLDDDKVVQDIDLTHDGKNSSPKFGWSVMKSSGRTCFELIWHCCLQKTEDRER